jgi:glycosyltransferase involved in cell wall biosynthesis
MARILSVVWYRILPARFGGQKGIAEFNEELSRHHALYCLCSFNNDASAASYPVMPELPVSRKQVANPVNWLRIIRRARSLKVSHLLLEHCYYGLAGIVAKRSLGISLIVHAHNIEYTRFREMGKWWWPLLRILEKITCRQADLVLFKTAEDMDFARHAFRLPAAGCLVIPFGLNRKEIPGSGAKSAAARWVREMYGIDPGTKILLFSGTLDYAPNARALELIVHTLIPLLASMTDQPFRVIACGRIVFPEFHPLLELKAEQYTYAGLVDDITPYLLAADVYINPVLEGGGIKVKTMEALAWNLPVVSTGQGARGIDLSLTGTRLRVAEDGNWRQFCQYIRASWLDGSSTPSSFFEAYHWSSVIRPLLEKLNTR